MRFLYYLALFIGIYYLLKLLIRLLLPFFLRGLGKHMQKKFEDQFNPPKQNDDDDEFTDYEEVE